MKGRKGFISMLLLIIMCLCLIMAMYILFIVRYETLILSSSKRSSQSFYNSESKILMCIYQENYYENQTIPILQNAYRSRQFGDAVKRQILIDVEDLSPGDIESKVRLTFRDKEDRKLIRLNCESYEKGLVSEITAIGTVVNELFEIRKPIIDIQNIEAEYANAAQSLIREIEDNIRVEDANKPDDVYGFETKDYSKIILTPDKLTCTRSTMINDYIEGINKKLVFIVGKKHQGENIDFTLKKSELKDVKTLSGLIYVEGDINVTTDFTFNGIIIVNRGKIKVDQASSFTVNGMIIYCNNDEMIETQENLTVLYSSGQVQRYGNYLPGFFQININTIKSK